MDGTEIAVIAASWHLNDKITFAGLTPEFIREPAKAWRNYGSRVSFSLETALKDPEALDRVLNHARSDPYRSESQMFEPWFRGKPLTKYFLHLDLAKNKDGAGVALVHQEPRLDAVGRPVVRDGRQVWCNVVDLVHREVAPFSKEIDFKWLREKFVFELVARGFNIVLVSTDQWNCLSAGTLIATTRGLIPIETVRVGDTVASRSGPRRVERTFAYGVTPALRITTTDGDVITGTRDHRLEAAPPPRYAPWAWTPLKDLVLGSRLRLTQAPLVDTGTPQPLAPLVHPATGPKGALRQWSPPETLTPALSEWLGVVWGDGAVRQDGVSITAHATEADDLRRVTKAVFGFAPPYKSRGSRHGVVEVSSRALVRWMAAHGIVKPLIPDIVLRSPRAVKAAFLRGLFAADGHVSATDGAVSLSTSNEALAQQVRVLLRAEFGLASYLLPRRRRVTLPQGTTFDSQSWVITVRGSRRTFSEAIGVSYRTKARRLAKHLHRRGRDLVVRVRSIEPTFADVYDLQVEGDHSYIANGIVSHNSVEFQQQVRARGIETDLESADRTPAPYDTLLGSINDGSLDVYVHPVFMKEIRELRRINGAKYDHPKTGSKDASDAVACALYRCIQHHIDSPPIGAAVISVHRNPTVARPYGD